MGKIKPRAAGRRGMPAASDQSRYTTDHDEIRQWVERRGGRPAVLGVAGHRPRGLSLRIDFPEYRVKAALKRITWDEFFCVFEAARYAFVYQEESSRGHLSRFYRFTRRSEGARRRQRRTAAP